MFETNSCGIFSAIHEQSADINRGVDKSNREDQAPATRVWCLDMQVKNTGLYAIAFVSGNNNLLIELAARTWENKQIKYLRPDAKSQVTIEYDDFNKPIRIDAIVISTQHDDFGTDEVMAKKIYKDMVEILVPRVKRKWIKKFRLYSIIKSIITLILQENLSLEDLMGIPDWPEENHRRYLWW